MLTQRGTSLDEKRMTAMMTNLHESSNQSNSNVRPSQNKKSNSMNNLSTMENGIGFKESFLSAFGGAWREN